MIASSRGEKGLTVVELAALLVILVIILSAAIPKLLTAPKMRKGYDMSKVLTRIWDSEYVYHHKHACFDTCLSELPINPNDLQSNWFSYSVPYATKDTFFVLAKVKRQFGVATTDDWAGISSAKIHTISNPKTLGKYALEWMEQIKRDKKRNR